MISCGFASSANLRATAAASNQLPLPQAAAVASRGSLLIQGAGGVALVAVVVEQTSARWCSRSRTARAGSTSTTGRGGHRSHMARCAELSGRRAASWPTRDGTPPVRWSRRLTHFFAAHYSPDVLVVGGLTMGRGKLDASYSTQPTRQCVQARACNAARLPYLGRDGTQTSVTHDVNGLSTHRSGDE